MVRKPRKPKPPEQTLHEACVVWLRAQHRDVLFWHTANESQSRPQYRAKLSRMGLQAGVPDLTFLFPGGVVCFVEFKAPGKYPSPAQRAFADAAMGRGALYAVCRDFDSFRSLIATWTQQRAASLEHAARLTA